MTLSTARPNPLSDFFTMNDKAYSDNQFYSVDGIVQTLTPTIVVVTDRRPGFGYLARSLEFMLGESNLGPETPSVATVPTAVDLAELLRAHGYLGVQTIVGPDMQRGEGRKSRTWVQDLMKHPDLPVFDLTPYLGVPVPLLEDTVDDLAKSIVEKIERFLPSREAYMPDDIASVDALVHGFYRRDLEMSGRRRPDPNVPISRSLKVGGSYLDLFARGDAVAVEIFGEMTDVIVDFYKNGNNPVLTVGSGLFGEPYKGVLASIGDNATDIGWGAYGQAAALVKQIITSRHPDLPVRIIGEEGPDLPEGRINAWDVVAAAQSDWLGYIPIILSMPARQGKGVPEPIDPNQSDKLSISVARALGGPAIFMKYTPDGIYSRDPNLPTEAIEGLPEQFRGDAVPIKRVSTNQFRNNISTEGWSADRKRLEGGHVLESNGLDDLERGSTPSRVQLVGGDPQRVKLALYGAPSGSIIMKNRPQSQYTRFNW